MLCSDYPGGQAAYEAEWSSMFTNKAGSGTGSSTYDKHESKTIPVSTHNVDEEYPAQLDVFIHKFELDKISADEALDGIKEIHIGAYVNARVTSDIVSGVGDNSILYKKRCS